MQVSFGPLNWATNMGHRRVFHPIVEKHGPRAATIRTK